MATKDDGQELTPLTPTEPLAPPKDDGGWGDVIDTGAGFERRSPSGEHVISRTWFQLRVTRQALVVIASITVCVEKLASLVKLIVEALRHGGH